MVKIKQAVAIIKFIFNRDLHKKEVMFYILQTLKQKIKLTYCNHNLKIWQVIFSYLIKVCAFNYISQINQVLKGQNLKKIPPNASLYFKHAKSMWEKYFNFKRLNKR